MTYSKLISSYYQRINNNHSIELEYDSIETYENQLFDYYKAFAFHVLLKDLVCSEKLVNVTNYLPQQQK